MLPDLVKHRSPAPIRSRPGGLGRTDCRRPPAVWLWAGDSVPVCRADRRGDERESYTPPSEARKPGGPFCCPRRSAAGWVRSRPRGPRPARRPRFTSDPGQADAEGPGTRPRGGVPRPRTAPVW